MNQTSYMNYHIKDYMIVSTIDFQRIQNQLFEAGLIDEDEISKILNSSNNQIKQNIQLLKILFEAKKDFTPFIEILKNDENSPKHMKLAKQISAPEMLVSEEKRRLSTIAQQNSSKSLFSMSNDDFIANLFKELSFVPKSIESQEIKGETESGIYSEGELNPENETILSEENDLIPETDSSDDREIEYDDSKIILRNKGKFDSLNHFSTSTLHKDAKIEVSHDTNKIMVSNKMKRFKLAMLVSSMVILGLLTTHVFVQQPSSWIRSLFKLFIRSNIL
ncbi:hypothetical protein LOD99_11890 [Oopsacas minuta]|uniref:Uncharacterized protein n=1 Tax=Oopsacas minuta TaxID=111878 RepID=A0AAV7JH89_9METZ|nr:hypothetical protein LOD99_11890 [Oopsacas minuta]